MALDCIARMEVDALQALPKASPSPDTETLGVATETVEELINGSEVEARERSRAARRRTSDPTYDYNKLGEATRQLRQVESEIDGKDWTRKTVQQLSRTLMDVREILMGTQNKAAEIEIGSALHRHVVSAVQYAEALQGAPDTEMLERIRIGEVLTACLKSVADQRQEMTQDDIGHGDIESWVTKWQQRRAKQAAEVLTAARALDERMRAEVESRMRSERDVDNVPEVDKEEFVTRMNDVRQRTLSEQEGIVLDEERVEHVRHRLESLFHDRDLAAEKRLLDVRNRRGRCLDVIEQRKDHLVHILNEIKQEYATIGGLAQVHASVRTQRLRADESRPALYAYAKFNASNFACARIVYPFPLLYFPCLGSVCLFVCDGISTARKPPGGGTHSKRAESQRQTTNVGLVYGARTKARAAAPQGGSPRQDQGC
eukprot:Tamp_05716.p2 GENE.Tamp_05716~~Tamp_05716.p2  ORF type:complete len:464 (+),score=94.54 Tamp_05716:108-1394(+)